MVFLYPRSFVRSSFVLSNSNAGIPKHVKPQFDVCAGAAHSAAAGSHRATSCTIVPSFVDTNILVYAEDVDAKAKNDIARELILQLWDDGDGVLSIQVLQEFYVTVTRKVKKPLSNAKAFAIVEEYLAWKIVDNTARLLTSAIELHQKAKISFWDAMVVVAAVESGCDRLYTEDLNHGQRFDSVLIVNPFKHA